MKKILQCLLILPILVLAILVLSFCESTGTPSISFATDIMPIFSTKCIECHQGEGADGNLDLSSYTTLMSGNSNHGENLVVSGNAEQSLLYKAVDEDETIITRMPQGGPYLTSFQIQMIEDWINEGARNN
jgi:hypothetical protein